MEAFDRNCIDDLILCSKFGFSLENLSQYFKIHSNEVIEILAQIVDIQPKILSRVLMFQKNELSLQEISEHFEIDITKLRMFLPEAELSVDAKETIKRCIEAGYSKENLILCFKTAPEATDQLSRRYYYPQDGRIVRS